MSLTVYPILAQMAELYRQPRTPARFKTYLEWLQGEHKDEMVLPIMGYNPMAREHVLDKIEQLLALDAEGVAAQALATLPPALLAEAAPLTVVFNLADDLHGSWTDRYATDFDSKFKIQAVASRGFSTPYFWSSEDYSPELIRERTLAAVCRTRYWQQHGRLQTLADYVAQEVFVARYARPIDTPNWNAEELVLFAEHYATHRESDSYALIFNFFYGDAASAALGYATYGVGALTGFAYARYLSTK